MAARVSSSSRLAYLHHHPLSSSTATNHSSILHNSSIVFPPSPSPSSSTPCSSPGSVHDPEPSPSTLSLTASDASGHDYSCLLTPSTINSGSSLYSTPATSPIPPHSPLEPVAESSPSAASTLLSRNSSHQPQPQSQHQQQSGPNSARGDLKTQRAGGFLAFAASALDRTQSAISPTGIRHKRSLSRLSISGDSAAFSRPEPSPDKTSRHRPVSAVPSSPAASTFSSQSVPYKVPSSQFSRAQEPLFSQPYTETDPSQPLPVLLPRVDNKMHQTSSRLLRMTDDDRPFTKVSSNSSMLIRFCCSAPVVCPSTLCPVAKQHCAWGDAAPTHVGLPSHAKALMMLMVPAGLQGSLCDANRQSASAVCPPCKVDQSRAHLSLRRCHQQPGLAQVLPIQSHA